MRPDPDIKRTEKWRSYQGYTVRGIAAEIGVAPSTYSRWRRGLSEMNDQNLSALSDLTGIPLSTYLRERARRTINHAAA